MQTFSYLSRLIFLMLMLLTSFDGFAKVQDDLGSRILNEIRQHPEIHFTRIQIEVGRGEIPLVGRHFGELKRGTVRIAGEVGSQEERRMVYRIVSETPGVDSVIDELTISPVRIDSVPTRCVLAQEITQKIQREPSHGQMNVVVQCIDGTVLLEGKVDSEVTRSRFEEIAAKTPGVLSVKNRLTLRATPSDDQIRVEIVQALKDNGVTDLENLRIAVVGGVVTFSGDRINHRDIDHILSIALMISGVNRIQSEMTIQGRSY